MPKRGHINTNGPGIFTRFANSVAQYRQASHSFLARAVAKDPTVNHMRPSLGSSAGEPDGDLFGCRAQCAALATNKSHLKEAGTKA
jgi:hypothetical protein